MKHPKPSKTPIAFFAAQYAALLVGQPGGFKTLEDLCRYANNECGITGISMPTGMLDRNKILNRPDYADELKANFEKWGTRLIGLENHIVGQRVCMHPAVLPRFRKFAPSWAQHLDNSGIEKQATEEMMADIDVALKLGINTLHTFPGGKSTPVLTQPWNAHPDKLRQKTLAMIAIKWEDILAYAGSKGVTIGFELRHIMEDICSVADLLELRDKYLLKKDAQEAIRWAADFSHYQIDDDCPVHDAMIAIDAEERIAKGERGVLPVVEECHAKFGFFNKAVAGHSKPSANLRWAERAGKFCTFAVHHPEEAKLLIQLMQMVHERRPGGAWIKAEGECMFLMNPQQSMRVTAENIRLIQDGKDPIQLADIVPEKWDGPTFDSFADTGYTAEEAMGLTYGESAALQRRLQTVGDLG